MSRVDTEQVLKMNEMSSKELIAAMRIMTSITAASFIVDTSLYLLIVLKLVEISLSKGGTSVEKIIQQAIDKATKNITSIVIAHRLSTIKNADKIIFIENNKIAEAGTPEQLIKQKGKFYNLLNASKP